MTHRVIECLEAPVQVKASIFTSESGACEVHLMLEPTRYADVQQQLHWLERAYQLALCELNMDVESAVFRRLFCSDPTNQASAIQHASLFDINRNPCAVSVVGQAPAGNAKVALWAYHLMDAMPLNKEKTSHGIKLHRDQLIHGWTTHHAASQANGSYDQTELLMNEYVGQLQVQQLTLADHVMRTWFYVRDIDVNYAGLVSARRNLFNQHGLTADTHYIASSGIGGSAIDPQSLVTMDAYTIANLQPTQVRYLKALDHLSPTAVYGVTFERATAIDYRDRRHIIVSGTASIDAHGKIVHPGDVRLQLDRTLDNITALLAEGDATLRDMNHWIVYLRDASDAPMIRQLLHRRIGNAPLVMVTAAVCRPGWLIEIEGMATVSIHRPDLPEY